MAFNDVENREWRELVPGVRARTFWGNEMMVCHVALDEGAVVPTHSHPHEQVGTVVSGEIEFTVDGASKMLTAGDSYVIKGDVPHSVIAKTECRIFEVFSPVREEYK